MSQPFQEDINEWSRDSSISCVYVQDHKMVTKGEYLRMKSIESVPWIFWKWKRELFRL